MNLINLQTFVIAAELGTFAAAATRLGVPKSTVSRRVAQLEEELGLGLVERTARAFELTDDGRALATRVGPALDEIAEVERGLGDEPTQLRGVLRLSTTLDFACTGYFSGLVAEMSVRHPKVRLEVRVGQRVVSLVEEGFDLAFRNHAGPLPERSELVARRIGRLTLGLYASPEYLSDAPPLEGWESLAAHRIVSFGGLVDGDWPAAPSVVVDEFQPLAALLERGAGVGVLPDFVAAPALRARRLRRLSVENRQRYPWVDLSLVWVRSRHLAPRLRAFIDLAVERAALDPWLREADSGRLEGPRGVPR